GESVRWDDVGTIPFDAFGAPGWEPRSRRAAQLQNPGQPDHGGNGAGNGLGRLTTAADDATGGPATGGPAAGGPTGGGATGGSPGQGKAGKARGGRQGHAS
ncbi:MAG TPA: hypothetical protein VK836_06245, partial [Streptosporangiaceae bacterium]|nr:hypothetical protein [Streptosporangiaceae bacterium]